jgi:hypothetical protein
LSFLAISGAALLRELHLIMRQAGTANVAAINRDHLAWPKT